MAQRTILIVDDDEEIRASLSDALSSGQTRVETAPNAETALTSIADRAPDLVLSDVRMPGTDGITLLGRIRDADPHLPVILMTAFDDLATVTTGMREGATEFLVKPIDLDRLRTVIARTLEDRSLRDADRETHDRTREQKGAPVPASGLDSLTLIGHDPKMVAIFKSIGQVAGTRTSVVIRGESGTGKELVARAIHTASPWAGEPFVAVNCTALPASLLESELFGHVKGAFTGAATDRKGRFALAGNGTLFLDEIGDTTPDFQSKLLRVLQERSYYPVGGDRPLAANARVLAATHRNLEEMVGEGTFREDLYYRLRVVEIVVPPLRERRGDIPELAAHLVHKAAASFSRTPPALSEDALGALQAHSWPGNVRELENCLTRSVVMAPGGVIRREHLALDERSVSADARLVTLDQVEHEHVAAVLSSVGGNRSHAADILGISRPRLRRLIQKYQLEGDVDEEADADD
jgi:DNA-binding NtrC family response regulator